MTNKPLRMPLEKVKKYADEHNVTFLDVVGKSSYEKKDYKVKGAVRIAPEMIKDEYEKLPKDKTVFAYCT